MEAQEEVADVVDEAKGKPKRKTARKTSARKSRAKAKPADPVPPSPEDIDATSTILPSFDPSERPSPEENVKSVEGLCAKYRVGEDLEMTVQVHRVWPQFYPDGVTKATGYLEESPQGITSGYVKEKYGGGKYTVLVYGPSASGGGRRVYGRTTLDIPGPMNADALNRRAREEQQQMGMVGQVQTHGQLPPAESPGVATKAMELVGSMNERSQRRIEALERQVVERTKGDDSVLHLVREMADTQSRTAIAAIERSAQQAAQTSRAQLEAEREARAALERRLDMIERDGRRSSNEDIQRFNTVLGQSTESAERIQQNMIDRHNEALRSQRESHEQTVRSMRDAHEAEKRVLNENRERDIQANDARWQAKLDRLDDQIKRLEEDRRRDRDEYDRRMRDREDSLRSQHESEKKLIETTWKSRLTTMEAAQAARVEGLEERISMLRDELAQAKSQVAAQGDAFAQIEKARSLLDMGRELVGTSGGGESKGDESTMDKILGVVAQDPGGILGALLGGGGAPQGAPPGMVPVQLQPNPQMMQMGMGAAPQPPGLPPPPQPRVMAPVGPRNLDQLLDDEEWEEEEELRRQEEYDRRRHASSRRQPPQQFVQQPPQPQAMAQQPQFAAPQPQRPRQPQPPQQPQQPGQAGAPQMSPTEAVMIGGFITKALDDGDDPDEFARAIFTHLSPQQIAALFNLGPDNVLALIAQHAPKSQALSPAGQRYTHEVFQEMLEIARQVHESQGQR